MYTETWKCPKCELIEKFNRPKQRVWHDCRGKNFSMPEHSVDLVKIVDTVDINTESNVFEGEHYVGSAMDDSAGRDEEVEVQSQSSPVQVERDREGRDPTQG